MSAQRSQLRRLTWQVGLPPANCREFMTARIQSVAVFGADARALMEGRGNIYYATQLTRGGQIGEHVTCRHRADSGREMGRLYSAMIYIKLMRAMTKLKPNKCVRGECAFGVAGCRDHVHLLPARAASQTHGRQVDFAAAVAIRHSRYARKCRLGYRCPG